MAVSYGHFATFAHSLKSGAKKSFASYPAVNLANARSYHLKARTPLEPLSSLERANS
ncbi:hypothetical protein [Proteus hauseri]|uniref:hypothetical protein n=1 Tax=Proteus hauseri TaxID=183417 RepID=UPI0013E90D9C|nr:hypothetical protein [Proteus hauseri]